MKLFLGLVSCSLLIYLSINVPLYSNAVSSEIGLNWTEVDTHWKNAGTDSVPIADSIYYVNIIPSYVVNSGQQVLSASEGDNQDDTSSFQGLLDWIRGKQIISPYVAQIYIPPGVYNFSDQIIMHSNISLKGAGSHQTELKFLIRADSTSSTMSTLDCRKDAILVSGTDDNYIIGVGIEDLKIVRIRDGLSERHIPGFGLEPKPGY